MDTEKMYLDKFCCICMNKSDLKHLFEVDSDGVSHYNKLTLSIAEMNFKEMNDQRFICGECYVTLNTVYNFRQMCLRSKTNLITYISQLQTSSHIKIKKEIEVKCEFEDIGDSFEDFSNSKCFIKIKSDPDDISALNKCCVCLRDQSGLKHMFEVDNRGMSHYNKLTSSIAEMNFKEMNNQRLICAECCDTLNTVYNFRQTCLRSKTNLITHISQLQTSSQTSRTDCLSDIKPELIVVKNERGSENEGSNCLVASNHQIKFERSVENIGSSASVKEECESGDDDSSAHEVATVDHVNESARSDVKVEHVEHQTMMEGDSKYYVEFNMIEIKEDPLAVVKEELMPDTETPQDGSTSQADTGTKGFNCKRSLTEQMKTHASERPYECKICKKNFNFKSGLTIHMKAHSNERPFECLICKKGFKFKSNCTEHMKTHASERTHECKICKKFFNFKSSLNVHMQTHHSERPYECKICKESFNYKARLNEHMKTHPKENPFECEICKKGFHYKVYLTEHMRKHSNERPYECEICKKGFNFKNNLAVHMKIHSSEKPFECEICKKRFDKKTSCIGHMERHSMKNS